MKVMNLRACRISLHLRHPRAVPQIAHHISLPEAHPGYTVHKDRLEGLRQLQVIRCAQWLPTQISKCESGD
jgi:hypothetical protein